MLETDISVLLVNSTEDYNKYSIGKQNYEYCKDGTIFLRLNSITYNWLDVIKKELNKYLILLTNSINSLIKIKEQENLVLTKLPDNDIYISFMEGL